MLNVIVVPCFWGGVVVPCSSKQAMAGHVFVRRSVARTMVTCYRRFNFFHTRARRNKLSWSRGVTAFSLFTKTRNVLVVLPYIRSPYSSIRAQRNSITNGIPPAGPVAPSDIEGPSISPQAPRPARVRAMMHPAVDRGVDGRDENRSSWVVSEGMAEGRDPASLMLAQNVQHREVQRTSEGQGGRGRDLGLGTHFDGLRGRHDIPRSPRRKYSDVSASSAHTDCWDPAVRWCKLHQD